MRRHYSLFIMILAIAATCWLAVGQDRGQSRGGGNTTDRMMQNDSDGDGKLSKSELPERFARIFDQADANSDGYLDQRELEAFFANRSRGARGEGGGREARDAGGDADFGKAMGAIGRGMRQVGRSSFGADTRERDLEAVSAIQAAIVAAKQTMTSVEVSEQGMRHFNGDRAAYLKGFRLKLISALSESLRLEKAIIEGDADAGRASVKKLVSIRDNGHELFQHAEDEDKAPSRERPRRERDRGNSLGGGSGG